MELSPGMARHSYLQQKGSYYGHRVVELLHVKIDEGTTGGLLQEHVVQSPPKIYEVLLRQRWQSFNLAPGLVTKQPLVKRP